MREDFLASLGLPSMANCRAVLGSMQGICKRGVRRLCVWGRFISGQAPSQAGSPRGQGTRHDLRRQAGGLARKRCMWL